MPFALKVHWSIIYRWTKWYVKKVFQGPFKSAGIQDILQLIFKKPFGLLKSVVSESCSSKQNQPDHLAKGSVVAADIGYCQWSERIRSHQVVPVSIQEVNGKKLPPVWLADTVQKVRHVVNTEVIRHTVDKVWSWHKNHLSGKVPCVPVPQLGTIVSVGVVPEFKESGILVGNKNLSAESLFRVPPQCHLEASKRFQRAHDVRVAVEEDAAVLAQNADPRDVRCMVDGTEPFAEYVARSLHRLQSEAGDLRDQRPVRTRARRLVASVAVYDERGGPLLYPCGSDANSFSEGKRRVAQAYEVDDVGHDWPVKTRDIIGTVEVHDVASPPVPCGGGKTGCASVKHAQKQESNSDHHQQDYAA